MKFASIVVLSTLLAAPSLAMAQDSTPATPPSTDCSVSGGCSSSGSGAQPNTTPDSTLEGGNSGSSGGSSGSSGTLDNTGSGSTVDPGDSSGSGGSSGNGAAGPLENTTPD